jgi:hypothetical protein
VWAGLWDSSSAGAFKARMPLEGEPKEYFVDVATGIFHLPVHGYSDGDTVVFYGGSVPGGISLGAIYYIRDATTDTFKVTTIAGGTAAVISSYPTTKNFVISRVTVFSGGAATVAVGQIAITGTL